MKRMTTPAIVAGLAIAGLVAAALPVSAAPAPASPVRTTLTTSLSPRAAAATCGTIDIPGSIAGMKPGDLVGDETVTTMNAKGTADLLPTANAWRILYVSSGVDENSPELVCGLFLAPKTWTADAKGRVIAWAHGTTGLRQDCQPSANPSGIVGPTPGGLGALAWGVATFSETNGLPENGMLAKLIDDGYVIAATDYFSGIMPGGGTGTPPLQHYAAGVPSGANVLDSVRAGISLLSRDDSRAQTLAWDMLTWGHSQGGGSALWAGQLARKYLAQTSPTVPVGPIRLVGVAAEAPATSFAAPSTAPTQLMGSHLGDLDMHQKVPLGVVNIAIGPVLFSYVLPNWAQLSQQTPSAGAKFPASPRKAGDPALDIAAMLAGPGVGAGKTYGLKTADEVSQLCLNKESDAAGIYGATYLYNTNPDRNFYFVPQIWGRADTGYKVGYLDQTCATSTEAAIQSWCRWLRFNQPGPNGQNPYDKLPRNDQGLVPMFVMQGEGDNILYCDSTAKNPDGTSRDQANPQAKWCLAKQFADSLRPAYCPNKGPANGSLQTGFWPVQDSAPIYHPATHMSLPGQVAAATNVNGGIANNPQLVFANSPLYAFMNAAFNSPNSLPRGCSQQVMWDN